MSNIIPNLGNAPRDYDKEFFDGLLRKIERNMQIVRSNSESYLTELVQDTSPQLGGGLDMNGFRITGDLLPETDATYDLGSGTYQWKELHIAADGLIGFNNSDVTLNHTGSNFIWVGGGLFGIYYTPSSASSSVLEVSQNFDSANVSVAKFRGAGRVTPANGDEAYVQYNLENSTGSQVSFGRFVWQADTVTSGSEDGRFELWNLDNGVDTRTHVLARDYTYFNHAGLYFNQFGTVTSPIEIRDTGFNQVFAMRSVASATNHIEALSAASGNTPAMQVSADSGGTNVNFGIAAKGTGLIDLQDGVKMTNVITPSQITSNQNNYAPTGYENCSIIRLSSDAERNITGIGGGADGRMVVLLNIGSFNIYLADESASSTAANRFATAEVAGSYLNPGNFILLCYDGTSSRWRVLRGSNERASQAQMEAASEGQRSVVPSIMQYHPGVAKCWVVGTPNSTTIITSHNITSLGDTATGQQTVTIATDFSSANYCVQVTVDDSGTTLVNSATVTGRAAGSYIMNSVVEAGSGVDPSTAWHSVAYGDQ